MDRRTTGLAQPSFLRSKVWFISLALLGWLHVSNTARADADAIRGALQRLVPYDLEGNSTFDALAELSARIQSEKDPRVQRDLSFVHAVAVTDLWILAKKTRGLKLEARLAKAMGVSQETMPRALMSALDAIKDPVLADIVRDSRHALLLTWPEATSKVAHAPVGPRTSVLYVDTVLDAFGPDKNPVPTLATMAEDPCPEVKHCRELYRVFNVQGRKAIRAVETAIEVLGTLRDDVMMHDPFVQAIAPRVEANAVLLPGLEFAPSVMLERAEERAHLTDQGTPNAPEMIAFVSAQKLEMAFVPRVRVMANGQLELVAVGEPMLPNVREVRLAGSFPLVVRTIEDLVTAFKQMREQAPEARIAIAASPDIPAHLWARALLSAKAADFSRIALLGVGRDGSLRALDVDVVSAFKAADVGNKDVNVMVRLGGFTVQRGGPSISLPRIKDENGFSFDYAGLKRSVQGNVKSSKLTFMSDVASRTIAETAFMVAPKNQPLTVVLP